MSDLNNQAAEQQAEAHTGSVERLTANIQNLRENFLKLVTGSQQKNARQYLAYAKLLDNQILKTLYKVLINDAISTQDRERLHLEVVYLHEQLNAQMQSYHQSLAKKENQKTSARFKFSTSTEKQALLELEHDYLLTGNNSYHA